MGRRLLLAVLGLLLAACSSNGGSGDEASTTTAATTPSAQQTLDLTADSNGKTVSLRPGQQLTVSLKANQTTGYGWDVQQLDQNVVKQVGPADYRTDSHPQGMAGVGGTAVFHLTAVAPGTTTLLLGYRRPWEKDMPPAQTFTVTLQVG